MASYGINLDLRLNGQSAVDRAVRGAKSLEAIVKRLNDKPLNLHNIGGAARTAEGRLGEARKAVIAFTKELNKSDGQFASTEAGLREYVAAFRQLAANTEAGTSTFNEFVGALAKAEQQLDEVAHATENAKRKALGLLSIEEEAAEQARKEAQRKAKDKEAKARRDNERAAQREARELKRVTREKEREAKIEERRRKEQRRRKFTDIATGVGFPLLFGGGVGSAVGGLIGGAFGGLGGSVLGSALGQGLDKAVGGLTKFAVALDSATGSLAAVTQAIGVTRTPLGRQIGLASRLGIPEAGTAAAKDRLEALIGKEGVESFRRLGDETVRLANSFEQLKTSVGAGAANIVTPIVKAINATIGLPTGTSAEAQARSGKIGTLQGTIAKLEADNAPTAAIAPYRQQLKILEQQQQTFETNKQLQADIETVTGNLVQLEKDKADLAEIELTARRDTLAFQKGSISVQQIANDLAIVQIRLRAGAKGEEREILKLQQQQLEQQKRAAEAARNNARIQAERQIIKEQIAGAGTRIQLINDASNLQLQFLQNEEGRFSLVAEEFQMIRHNLDINKGLLELQRKSALIGVNELERVSAINREYDLRGDLLERQAELQAQALIQAKAAHDVARMQVAQTREMETLTARMNAQQQIAATSPFANEGFLTDPFFGESSKLEAEQALDYANTLEQLNKQLDQVTARRLAAADASPQLRQSLEDEQAALRNQIANYKEYQPAINEAALAQARFNDALQIAVPVTDSLFDSLMAVAEGTKTAQQAFADFLRMIADMLMKAAAQMIATYIAIGVARMFAGVPSGSEASGTDKHLSDLSSAMNQYSFDFGGGMASGGRVSSGTSYLVGEKGPELFTPGASGTITPNHAMGGMASNIVVNVDASGSSVEGNANEQKQLGEAIGVAIRQELIKQKRPGGLLA